MKKNSSQICMSILATWETVIKMDNQQRQCRVHILLLFGCSSPSGSDGVESEGKS